jgi:protein-disulfide isomerase
MLKTSHLLIGAGAVAALYYGGSYLLKLKRLSNELESETKVAIHKVSLSGVDLMITVRLKNPSGGSIKVKHPFVKMIYGEKTIASSQVKDIDITVEKYSEVNLDPIKITLGFLSLATTAPALMKEYRETGKLNLVVHTVTTINDSLPYTKTDNITLGGGKQA